MEPATPRHFIVVGAGAWDQFSPSKVIEDTRSNLRNEIGPYKCITDLGIFSFDKEKRIMKLEALYPDTTVDDILKNTEFKPIIPEKVPTVTPPTRKEIDILRRIADPSGVRRMEFRPEQLKRSFLI